MYGCLSYYLYLRDLRLEFDLYNDIIAMSLYNAQ